MIIIIIFLAQIKNKYVLESTAHNLLFVLLNKNEASGGEGGVEGGEKPALNISNITLAERISSLPE